MLIWKIFSINSNFINSDISNTIHDYIVNNYSNYNDSYGFIKTISRDKIKILKIETNYMDNTIQCHVIINADIININVGEVVDYIVTRKIGNIVRIDVYYDNQKIGIGALDIHKDNSNVRVGDRNVGMISRIAISNNQNQYIVS